MRYVSKAEKKKRGCVNCIDLTPDRKRGKRVKCPYEECPYHELDKYDTYDAFLKATGYTSVDDFLKKLKKSRRSVTACDHFLPRVTIWGRK